MLMYEKLIRDALETQTIRELSRELDLPTQTINDWTVLNKRPRIASLIKVASWSELPLWAMLIDTEGSPADMLAEQIIRLSRDQQHQLLQQAQTMNHAHQPR
jgi:hypothetical protein